MLRGGYPEVLARPQAASLWFSSYLQTYLERDVRSISAVQDLVSFRQFLGIVASRHGQVLNKSDLAAPLGMSVPSVGRWLDILEATAQILVVPPYFDNFGKRLIKSPKIYIADSGLACHLLGIETEAELAKSPFQGALFEGFIAAEIVKSQINAGRRRELVLLPRPAGPGGGLRRSRKGRRSASDRSQGVGHRDSSHGRADAETCSRLEDAAGHPGQCENVSGPPDRTRNHAVAGHCPRRPGDSVA